MKWCFPRRAQKGSFESVCDESLWALVEMGGISLLSRERCQIRPVHPNEMIWSARRSRMVAFIIQDQDVGRFVSSLPLETRLQARGTGSFQVMHPGVATCRDRAASVSFQVIR